MFPFVNEKCFGFVLIPVTAGVDTNFNVNVVNFTVNSSTTGSLRWTRFGSFLIWSACTSAITSVSSGRTITALIGGCLGSGIDEDRG